MSFVHLHNHSEFSLLDGAAPAEEIPKVARELGQEAVAITDHGWLAGAVIFQTACLEQDVKPIIGSEIYMATQEDMSVPATNPGDNFHLTVLCQNPDGYANLRRLTSLAHLDGLSYKPRIDKKTLREHSDGLIVMSGCVAAELPQALIYGHEKKARGLVEWYLDTFGENFYIELMAHGSTDNVDHVRIEEDGEVLMYESELNDALVRLAFTYGIPLVATNDAHYLRREDGDAHDTLLCIGMGAWKEKEGRMRFPGAEHAAWEFYMKSGEEMLAAADTDFWREACENTIHLASTVESQIIEVDGDTIIPRFDVPEDDPEFKLWKAGVL